MQAKVTYIQAAISIDAGGSTARQGFIILAVCHDLLGHSIAAWSEDREASHETSRQST